MAFPLWPEQALRAHAAMDDLDDLFSSDTEDEEAARAKFARKLEEAKLQKEEGNQLLKRGATDSLQTLRPIGVLFGCFARKLDGDVLVYLVV